MEQPGQKGPFKSYITQMGGWVGVNFSGKKHYEGVRCNDISVTRGWVGVQFPEEEKSVTKTYKEKPIGKRPFKKKENS